MLAHKYGRTYVQVGLPTVPNCLGHPEFWVILSSSLVFQSQPFLFVSVKRENITVKCNLSPGDKRLSTALDSKHLLRQHEQVKLVERDHHASTEGQTAPTQIEYLKSRLNILYLSWGSLSFSRGIMISRYKFH